MLELLVDVGTGVAENKAPSFRSMAMEVEIGEKFAFMVFLQNGGFGCCDNWVLDWVWILIYPVQVCVVTVGAPIASCDAVGVKTGDDFEAKLFE